MFSKTGKQMTGGISEQGIQNRIRIALSRGPTRLFRNNTGALQDKSGRLVYFGLCKGSPDLVGWTTVKVTPEMVGQEIAVFVGLEVKKPKGQPTALQKLFLSAVQVAGGISGVARSLRDAEEIVYNNKFANGNKSDPAD